MHNISHAFVAEMMSSPLQTAFLLIAVIGTVGHDDVVDEIDAHKVASLFDILGELIVLPAGRGVVAGMVVAESQYRGIA